MRRLLLSEYMSIKDIFDEYNINDEKLSTAVVLSEYEEIPSHPFIFNNDILLTFVERSARENLVYSSVMLPAHPLVLGGPDVFVTNTKDGQLIDLDFMFGASLSINYYRRYISAFNEKLEFISNNGNLILFPIKRQKKLVGYFRFWVLKERMTVLYYPNDSLPRYDCDIEEYYRSDNCGINLLKDKDKIVAIDGWMKIPDELQTKSDMRLVTHKEKK